jgi:hypothetical protein
MIFMKYLKSIAGAVIFFMFALAFALPVSAHGLATSKNAVVGNYFIAFEYDTLGNVSAGDFVSYDFDLLDANTKEFLDYSRLFFRLTQKGHNTPFLTGNIAPVDIFGKKASRINLTIPDPGEYTAKLDFYDTKNQKITEASFDYTVDPATQYGTTDATKKTDTFDPKKYLWVVTLIGGVIIGMIINKAMKRKPKHEQND